jgi:YVTN family beta-propeller protein
MGKGIQARALLSGLAVMSVGLLASGCDWSQLGFLPNHASDNPETTVNTSNVSTMTEAFTTSPATAPVYSQPVVANGVMYAISVDGQLSAYSANGTSRCSSSPTVCAPLWSASLALGTGPNTDISSPAVVNGVVYALAWNGADPGELEAFDAAGTTNCSGTPTVCTPLWQATVNAGEYASPTVSNGVVYVEDGSIGGKLEAFDANGVTDCSGTPKSCSPLWTSTAMGTLGFNGYTVTVANNVAYAASVTGSIYAFDANGVKGCSGTPAVCSPLWQYSPTVAALTGYPVVVGGTLYVDSFSFTGTAMNPGSAGALEAFDADGVTNCSGTPKVCNPLWQTAGNTYASQAPPAVAGGKVFVGAFSGPVTAFDANGVTNCSGAPRTCAPVWQSSTTSEWGALTVGGNVLYAAGGNQLYAFDATGTASCASSVCNPLWSPSNPAGVLSVTIANGMLYGSGFIGTGHVSWVLFADALPPPATTVLIPSTGATQSGRTALLDASASTNVTSVKFEVSGGTITDQVVATGTPTLYGWLTQWNTYTVPNGSYSLQSVACYSGGNCGTSSPVTVDVFNPPTAYVTDSTNPGVVTPINTANNTPGQPIANVGADPGAIAVSPDGETAYVMEHQIGGTITLINLVTGIAGTPITLPANTGPVAMAITPDGSTGYLVDGSPSSPGGVLPIDLASGTVGARIPVFTLGAGASAIVMSPDGKTAYVSSPFSNPGGEGYVIPIDTATNTAGTPIQTTGHGPTGLAITPDGKTLYVTNFATYDADFGLVSYSNTVTPIDTATATAGPPITVGTGPVAVAITPDGRTAYVTNIQSGDVTPIDIATNTAGGPITLNTPLAANPGLIAITPDGSTAYVVSQANNEVIPIDTATKSTEPPISVSEPLGIAIH